jgi:hypothetical protein
MFDAKVVLASIGPCGIPIYTIQATYPRFIHGEVLTHRDKARNSASSRAIPWKRKGKHQVTITELPPGAQIIGKGQFNEISLDENETYEYYVANCMYSYIMSNPVIPIHWGKEQTGMQSNDDELTGDALVQAKRIWLEARDNAVRSADQLAALGLHKSLCNRLTEPWMWMTCLLTGTEWRNFFRLRCHPAAERHFQKIAGMIRDEISKCKPRVLRAGQWHLPYFDKMTDNELMGEEIMKLNIQIQEPGFLTESENQSGKSYMEFAIEKAKMISAGRSARLSYLTHEGIRDFKEDINLCKKLIERDDDVLHVSPLEHINQATDDPKLRSGPMRGWKQFRKEFKNENIEG